MAGPLSVLFASSMAASNSTSPRAPGCSGCRIAADGSGAILQIAGNQTPIGYFRQLRLVWRLAKPSSDGTDGEVEGYFSPRRAHPTGGPETALIPPAEDSKLDSFGGSLKSFGTPKPPSPLWDRWPFSSSF